MARLRHSLISLVLIAAPTALAQPQPSPPVTEIGPSPTGTVVYRNINTRYASGISLGKIGSDLHMLRGGNMTFFEFTVRLAEGQNDLNVVFYTNDPNDGGRQAGDLGHLASSSIIATVPVSVFVEEPLPPVEIEGSAVHAVRVEVTPPIELPKDVWMVLDLAPGFYYYGTSTEVEIGTTHLWYTYPFTLDGVNFAEPGIYLDFSVWMEPSPLDTPMGDGVLVQPEPGLDITFSHVLAAGATTVTTSATNPGPDLANFEFLGIYYNIETNAQVSGQTQVCLAYDDSGLSIDQEQALQLMHFDGNSWQNITSSPVDTDNNEVCGLTSSFSPFAIGHSIPHPAQHMIEELIGQVASMNLNHGIANSLDAKLLGAQQALEDFNENNNGSAFNRIMAFMSAVEAQRGNQIPEEDADALIGAAMDILPALLG